MTKKERYEKVLAWFKQNMGKVETELHYGSPFQLLVAVMLSAQCTDKRVNMVTPALFEAYPDAQAMSKASEADILSYVKSVTYPNAKAKHLLETAKIVAESYGGEVPDDDKLLQKLPGVGRKTAHVVQAVLYNRPEMPVDTHVFRVSARIGFDSWRHIPADVSPFGIGVIVLPSLPDKHSLLAFDVFYRSNTPFFRHSVQPVFERFSAVDVIHRTEYIQFSHRLIISSDCPVSVVHGCDLWIPGDFIP